jgi:predicted RNase H-like nuclease (RuvC/YqgF family)
MTHRIDTSALVTKCQAIALAVALYDQEFCKLLCEVVDRLEEQEATIKALRSEFTDLAGKSMSQEDTIEHLRFSLREASAVAANHCGTIGKLRAEIDSLNKRQKQ